MPKRNSENGVIDNEVDNAKKSKRSDQADIDAAFSVLDDYSSKVTFLDESTLSNVTDWFDTGSKMLNALISGSLYGGIPKGRITLLAGESGCGKSLICQKVIGNAQKKGMKVVVFDTENAIDSRMAESLGANPSEIKYFPVQSIEQCRNAIFSLLKKIDELKLDGKFMIVIDSVANMLSNMEMNRMDKDSASADMGTIAKAIKSLLKTCTSGGYTNTTFLVTNHIYDNPNEMYPDLVKTMSGGKACRYLPSVVVQMAKKNLKEKDSKEKDETALSKGVSGIEMRCMCVKNRFIRPLIEGSMYLSWKNGLDEEYGTLELATNLGVVIRRGSVYDLYDGTPLHYAKDFKNDKELWENKIYPEIERRIKEEWSYTSVDEMEDEIPEEDIDNIIDSE